MGKLSPHITKLHSSDPRESRGPPPKPPARSKLNTTAPTKSYDSDIEIEESESPGGSKIRPPKSKASKNRRQAVTATIGKLLDDATSTISMSTTNTTQTPAPNEESIKVCLIIYITFIKKIFIFLYLYRQVSFYN